MDSPELAEWQAFYALNPFGQERDDLRIAHALCVWADANKKEEAKAFTPEDFMLKFDPFGEGTKKEKKQSERQMKTVFGQMAKALDKRKKG